MKDRMNDDVIIAYSPKNQMYEVSMKRELLKKIIKDYIDEHTKDKNGDSIPDIGDEYIIRIRDNINTIKNIGDCWIFQVTGRDPT